MIISIYLKILIFIGGVRAGLKKRACIELTKVAGVKPIQYNLDLTFSGLRDADRSSSGKFWINGKLELRSRSIIPLCNIVLHAGSSEYLQITSAKVNDVTAIMDRNEEDQLLVLWPERPIENGTMFKIFITFTAFMRQSTEEKSAYLNGFYETGYNINKYVI